MRLLCALTLSACVSAAGALELHVSSLAAGGGTGTVDAPFRSVEEARNALRALPGHGPATVWLDGGVYPVTAPIRIEESDRDTTYRAKAGTTPILVGGAKVEAGQFRPVSDSGDLARLEESARGSVVVADLKAMGVGAVGEMPVNFTSPPLVPELFFNGVRMTLARWPNEGWAEIAEVIESGPAPWRNHASDKQGVFKYSGERPSRWVNAPGVWLQGYWCFDWSIESIKAAQIDTETKQITLATQHHYGIGSGNPAPRRYIAFNLLEELDVPGEYYIDRERGVLYFWPPDPLEGATVALSLLTEPAIQVADADGIAFEGLTVETTAGPGIHVKGGEGVRIRGCTIRNTGMEGVIVEGGEAHRIESCDIHDTGTHGIRIDGGDRKTLTSSRHEIVNCHLHHVSRRQRTAAYHITMNGVGIRVAHNEIHDAPHQSVLFSGNDHVFEFNEVYRVGMDSDDCGALYMGRNPSERGSVIRYNYFHDVGSDFAHGSCAVYFDDGTGGQQVMGNVFVRAAGGSFGAVFIHGGHDNLVKNNIFVDCAKAMGHAPWGPDMWKQWLGEELWQTRLLKEVDITSAVYLNKYPALAGYFDSWQAPRLNLGECNVVVKCKNVAEGDWQLGDTLVLRMDAGFVDAANGNYALKPDSVIYQRLPDFRPIPFDAIGMYTDEWRRE
ncbi:MAG: hypothetical protein AMXMBFR84_25340 [Candidatus Hydrogenedentota bacterium]